MLVKSYQDLLPEGSPVTILPAGQNRLINTPYQVEVLAEYCTASDIERLQVVGWGFHGRRVTGLFAAYGPQISVDYVPTESVLKQMDEQGLQDELDAMGFEVDFATILTNGIAKYAQRERLTRLPMALDKKGRIIKALSWLRDAGRYDDLTPDGRADMGLTDLPLQVR